jgi:hypothetical protein
VQTGENLSTLDLWYEGSAQYDVRFSLRRQIFDALLVTLGDMERSDFIPSHYVFSFLQLGPDPGPLELVTTWSVQSYLPSIDIPQGQILMRPSVQGDLIAYAIGKGVVPQYWENTSYEAEYIPP